jgi:hypothetical protein
VPSDPQSGYLLAPVKRDTNTTDQWFARAALSYLHQDTRADDSQSSNPEFPGRTYNFGLSGRSARAMSIAANPNATNTYRPGGDYISTNDALSPSSNRLDLANLLVSADLGFATFTSSTSGYRTVANEQLAYSPCNLVSAGGQVVNFIADFYAGFPRVTAFSIADRKDKPLVQEVRLVSNGEGPLSYVLGGSYQDLRMDSSANTSFPGLADYMTSIGDTLANPQKGDIIFGAPPGG